MNKINTLLLQVTKIQNKYEDVAKKNGENFNIFSIMNMESDEVYTHSAIIGELLNPNGSHGQGNLFLLLFIEEIRNSFGSDITLNNFTTLINDKICERTITREINWENVTGGRIDLIIEDQNQLLIIENKLDAIDQEYQLIRYNNYAETKKNKKTFLLYLTLNGKELKNETPYKSSGGLNIEGYNFHFKDRDKYEKKIKIDNIYNCLYYPISYEIHIRDWIEKCIKNTNEKPLLQATLQQYFTLIKKITFQTMSEEMKADIITAILENPNENIKSAFEISASLKSLKKKLYENLIQDLKNNESGYHILDTNHPDYYGVDINSEITENEIKVLFGKRKDKEYCTSVSCGYQINSDISKIRLDKYNSYRFEIVDGWVYKWISIANWGDSPDIWGDIAKRKNSEIYKKIISVINEIIEIEKNSN
jgi:hypothetical protein